MGEQGREEGEEMKIDKRAIRNVERDMGLEDGSIGTIAWLLLQAEAEEVGKVVEVIESGRVEIEEQEDGDGDGGGDGKVAVEENLSPPKTERFIKAANHLGITEAEAIGIVMTTTGVETESEAWVLWNRGVMSIRVLRQLYQGKAENAWDEVEALALEKTIEGLNGMTGNGDPAEMVRLAAIANKAIRVKAGGVKNGVTHPQYPGGPGQNSPMLAVGNLGVLQLQLSTQTVNQLQERKDKPKRIADNKLVTASDKVVEDKVIESRVMLDLKETRALVDIKAGQIGKKDDSVVSKNNVTAASLAELLGIMEEEIKL